MSSQKNTRKVLITGGAGFIGSNLAEKLLADPEVKLRIYDDLSRRGANHNLLWLQSLAHPDQLEFVRGDVRDLQAVQKAAADADEIYHLAAQVAVTNSVVDPRHDFNVNALGTLNVLEAARRSGRQPFVFFTSTNKVYGSLHALRVRVSGKRYSAEDISFKGVAESEPLDFHSPYGCSKGAADQYVRDYGRIYGLHTVVFRMSCIAGPRQFGTEDQGWVAHFIYSVLERKPITIYGNGFQVRDILHVQDLVNAIQSVRERRSRTRGEIFNLGGGLERAVSIAEMLDAIRRETGLEPILKYSEVRPGDQPLYISDTSRLTEYTGWRARHSWLQTLRSIQKFWNENQRMLADHRDAVVLPEFAVAEVA